MSRPVGVEIFRAYWARNLDGENVTGLTISDFDVTLRRKTSSDSSYLGASETVTLVEIDRTNLPGQYEFRFTPTLEAHYVLEVVPSYDDNTGDSFREDYDVEEGVELSGTNALCTVAQVKAYLGDDTIATDDLIEDTITRVTKWVQTYTGLDIFSTARTEYFDANGSDRLVLPGAPVSEVTAVYASTDVPRTWDSSTELTADDDYMVDLDVGVIYLTAGRFPYGPRTVRVDYTAGWASVPADLNSAAVRLVGLQLMQRKRLGMSSQAGDGASSGYYDYRALPIDIQQTLDAYRDPVWSVA